MADFSNSQKLAAVLSVWARPAISEFASSKLMDIPVMQSLQATIGGSGIVGQGYSLSKDIEPLIQPIVNTLITPIMEKYISNIPDNAIPATARAIVGKMKSQGSFSLLDGYITFEAEDIAELETLIEKNLPVEQTENYKVIY